MTRSQVLMVVAFAVVAGCSRMEVRSGYDRSADFNGMHTYAWNERPRNRLGDPRVDDTLLETRIRAAADAELAAKGYRLDATGSPDFLMDYDVAIEPGGGVAHIDTARGDRRGWAGTAVFLESSYEDGTVVLEVLEPGSGRVLWHAQAEAILDFQSSPEKRETRLRRATARMLKDFPPK